MAVPTTQQSRLRLVGYHTGDCGYCKGTESGASYYVMAKTLQPEHYQELMDRGWRRSGTLLYLPDAARSCCPHYTIRLPAAQFHSSRDQRQTLYRWNRFILGDQYIKESARRRPASRESKRQAQHEFQLSQVVHEAEAANRNNDLEPEHRLTVNLEPDTYSDEKFELFKNYQMSVHHETAAEITRQGFTRFLCASPIKRSNDEGKRLGSWHQCYRLDGRLMAMGVLDLLPHAVSGVYFIYHKDYEKWSPGKLSALRELSLTDDDGYENYYMGYYIHGCDKMKYKATYKQQYVLDHEDMSWNALDDEMKRLMDQRKYVSMSQERSMQAVPRRDGLEAVKLEYASPNDAVDSGRSLLDIGMPGVMTPINLHQCLNIGQIRIYLGPEQVHEFRDLVAWEDGDELDNTSIKGMIAEYAACVGPKVAREAVVDFSR